MVVEIRLYKRFDTDLVALVDAGYPVASMIRDAVVGFSNGSPVNFLLDEPVNFDLNGKVSVHTRFNVPESDERTCYVLRNIKKGYRNTFCKVILRNALIRQSIAGFFADASLSALCDTDTVMTNVYAFQNVVRCSEIRIRKDNVPSFQPSVPQMPSATAFTAQRTKKRQARPVQQQPAPMYGGFIPPYYGYPQVQQGPSMSDPKSVVSQIYAGMPVMPQMMPVQPQMPIQGSMQMPTEPVASVQNVPVPAPVPTQLAPPPASTTSVQESNEDDSASEADVKRVDTSTEHVSLANDESLMSIFDNL